MANLRKRLVFEDKLNIYLAELLCGKGAVDA